MTVKIISGNQEQELTTKKVKVTFQRQKYQDYKGDGWYCYICRLVYPYTCECPKGHGLDRGQAYWEIR